MNAFYHSPCGDDGDGPFCGDALTMKKTLPNATAVWPLQLFVPRPETCPGSLSVVVDSPPMKWTRLALFSPTLSVVIALATLKMSDEASN